jgi:hypothetical protein
MDSQSIQIKVPLSFNQVVDIVRQLSPTERSMLEEVLKETDDIDKYSIPEEHKNIVRQRMKVSEEDPSRLLNWDKVKHKLIV